MASPQEERKLAVVTGATRGIGLGLAKALVERGWRVVAVCRSSSEELAAAGAEVLAGIDLGQDGCVAPLRERFQGEAVSLLVCNAGLLRADSLEEPHFGGAREQFEINTLGPLRVASALQGSLGPGSKVAIITSKMGSLEEATKGGMYGYRISKAGANMVGRLLAADLAQRQVAVAMLHPGAVVTDLFDQYWRSVGKDGMAPSTHGYITVEESVAGLLARIEELSMETTGQFRRQSGESIPW